MRVRRMILRRMPSVFGMAATSCVLCILGTTRAASVTVDGGTFLEGQHGTLDLPIDGIGTFETVNTVQLRLSNLQHPFAEGLSIYLLPPRGGNAPIVDDLRYNQITPNGYPVSDIGFDGTYTFEAGTFTQKPIFTQFQETYEAGEDTLPSGTYAPSRGPLVEEGTLVNAPNLVANNKNGIWQLDVFDKQGHGVGSVGSVTLAINELLDPFVPGDNGTPPGDNDGMPPISSVPAPAAFSAGLALLGGLIGRRRRRTCDGT